MSALADPRRTGSSRATCKRTRGAASPSWTIRSATVLSRAVHRKEYDGISDRTLAPTHAGQACRAHEASDALAAHTDSVSAELRVDPRHAVRPTGAIVHGTNPIEEPGVRYSNTPCEARRRGEVGIGHDSPQAGSARTTLLIGVRLSRMPSRIRSIVL